VERGLRRQKIVPQASACCAKSPKFSDFPGVDPAQQQVRLNVTGVLDSAVAMLCGLLGRVVSAPRARCKDAV